ncbi:MAG: DUF5317 domain-containing protein [Bacillota bacterium]|nr:DUF5317 domain-containing protein [Bacillota bacterium]
MLIESIVFALILGLILGGKVKNLEKVKLKKIYLVFIAFFIEYLAGVLINSGKISIRESIFTYTYNIQLLVYILLMIFFVYNFKYLGIKFLAFGSFLNFFVIQINNGFMPVDMYLALKLGYYDSVKYLESGKVFGHKILNTANDTWIVLADIIDIPPPYFFPKSISIGDIVIGFGVFFLLFLNMFYSENKNYPI